MFTFNIYRKTYIAEVKCPSVHHHPTHISHVPTLSSPLTGTKAKHSGSMFAPDSTLSHGSTEEKNPPISAGWWIYCCGICPVMLYANRYHLNTFALSSDIIMRPYIQDLYIIRTKHFQFWLVTSADQPDNTRAPQKMNPTMTLKVNFLLKSSNSLRHYYTNNKRSCSLFPVNTESVRAKSSLMKTNVQTQCLILMKLSAKCNFLSSLFHVCCDKWIARAQRVAEGSLMMTINSFNTYWAWWKFKQKDLCVPAC